MEKLMENSKSTDREIGFEILRILAMLLISSVHVMNYGGMLGNSDYNSVLAQRILYAVFTPAVNVFVLITGYFMAQKTIKFKKILYLWLEVFSFSVVFYLINSLFISKDFNKMQLVWYCLPISANKFWFFSAYFLLYVSIPFLNKIVNNCSKRELYLLNLFVFVLSYLETRFAIRNIASLSSGYCYLWFVLLYFCGATVKKYPLEIKKFYFLFVYLLSTYLLWVLFKHENKGHFMFFVYNTMDYDSPLVLIISLSLIYMFRNIRTDVKILQKIIVFVSSTTFGIYLFQESSIKPYLYFKIINVSQYYGSTPFKSVLYVLLCASEIFALGFIVECIRKLICFIYKLTVKFIKTKQPTPPPNFPTES